MTAAEQINRIYNKVRSRENHIPRDHSTMGGMWTVDTWVSGDVKVQLCDEGSTVMLITDAIRAYTTYGREATFSQGTPKDLDALYVKFFSAV